VLPKEDKLAEGARNGKRRRHKNVVVMLGARMRRTRAGGWFFPLVSADKTNTGSTLPVEVSGGGSRLRALEAEYKRMKEAGKSEELLVLVTGGKEPCGASRSDEAARQLITKYGIPPDAVVSIGGEGSTLGNANATLDFLRTNKSLVGEAGQITILTNNYHMLRAWIIFSLVMLKANGQSLVLSKIDDARLRRKLRCGAMDKGNSSEVRIRDLREKVMEILNPYFVSNGIEILLLVVENVLEDKQESTSAGHKYASLLRHNKWVSKTLRYEYQCIRDLLWPKKRAKSLEEHARISNSARVID